jgi:Ca2+-binding EF-hand superfamily protein
MRRLALLLLMVTLLTVETSITQGQQPLTRKQIIESADRNKDGRIGRIELLERRKEAFFFIDNDKDGYVSVGEYRLLQGGDPKRFTAADRNKDGKLSLDEFLKAVSADFDDADKSDDGVIDAGEMRVWIAR